MLWQWGRKRKERLHLWILNSASFPCGSLLTELSNFCQSAQSRNKRDCKQTLKNTCKHAPRVMMSSLMSNVISSNQHFASTFLMQVIQIPEMQLQALLPFSGLIVTICFGTKTSLTLNNAKLDSKFENTAGF